MVPSAIQRRLRAILVGERLWQFAVVGVLGTACDTAVLFALYEFRGLPLEVAKVVGAEVAIVLMFLLNEHWTFSGIGAAGWTSLLRRLLTSNLVRAGGITVAVVVLSLLVRWFGIPYLIANLIGIGCGFVVNFTAESLLTWRVHD